MDYSSLDDAALLRLVANRNEIALGEIYDRFSRLVFSMAFQVLSDEAAAEEVTQDVFFSLWQKAHQYQQEQAKVVTWIASITRHRAIDLLRYRRSRPAPADTDWEDDPAEEEADSLNVESEIELAQQRKNIRQALARLPLDQQKALSLAFFQGLSHSEIAADLGEPLGTVKTRIRLAMQKLRQLLQETEAKSG